MEYPTLVQNVPSPGGVSLREIVEKLRAEQ